MTVFELQRILYEFPYDAEVVVMVASCSTDNREVGEVIDVSHLDDKSVRLLIHID
jgi:hypothetical protein